MVAQMPPALLTSPESAVVASSCAVCASGVPAAVGSRAVSAATARRHVGSVVGERHAMALLFA
jgi:hypothetical protein